MTQFLPDQAKRRVGDIMTPNVLSVRPDTSVGEIAHLIATNDITGVPVVDDDHKVIGVVTELDMIMRNTHFKMPNFIMILDMIVYLETPWHYKERVDHVLGTTAEEIMSEPPVTIAPEATIENLAELMIDRRMNPVPVVENDRLVGIVSRRDIIRLMAQEFNAAQSP